MSKAIWTNAKKQYRKQKCKGTYKTYRGKRGFFLEDVSLGALHRFDSHEAAKKLGWVKG